MCGICGAFILNNKQTINTDKLLSIMKALLIENEDRGTDSTGLATVNQDMQTSRVRRLGDAIDYLTDQSIEPKLYSMFNAKLKLVLGHTRFATTGDVNIKNAQPFIFENVIGTHNGIISNWQSIANEDKISLHTECDSEIIFALMARTDTPLKERSKALKRLSGSFAIAFHDKRVPDSVYFARGNNPLHVYQWENVLLWTSEEKHMQKIAMVFNLKLKKLKIKNDSLYRVSNAGIEKQIIKRKIVEHTSHTYLTQNDNDYLSWWSKEYNRHYASKEPKRLTYNYPAKYGNEYLECDWCTKAKYDVQWYAQFGSFICDKCLKWIEPKKDKLPNDTTKK